MKKPSFNKILESEFEPKKQDLNKIIEGAQHDNFDIDFGEDSWEEDGKEITSFEIFHDNETIAYGKFNVNTGEVKVGGSFYSDSLNDKLKDQEFNSIESLQELLSNEIAKPLSEEKSEIEENIINSEIPAETPEDAQLTQEIGVDINETSVTEDGIDPEQAIKMTKTEEELDSLANEYLMDDEYNLYIETKPDADFEDNKNFVLHLLTSGDEYEVKEDLYRGDDIKDSILFDINQDYAHGKKLDAKYSHDYINQLMKDGRMNNDNTTEISNFVISTIESLNKHRDMPKV